MLAIFLLLVLLVVQIQAFRKHCVGQGRYITLPMAKMYLIWWVRRQIKKGIHSGVRYMSPHEFRMKQLIGVLVLDCFAIAGEFTHGTSADISTYVFFLPMICLYADDLLSTIDKDKWKKRFSSLKNKVKWRWVPLPTPVRS